jgi:thymidylate synthase (FAD)
MDTNEITRAVVADLDSILGKPFKVLDDGFVRVIDYMGTDESIVQAARVSYGKGTKKVSEDKGLIRYLMRHDHTTPFEMCEIKLHVRVPMDCWRQWIRHRTANVNEYSTRYSIAIDSFQKTNSTEWRSQSTDNKQGSGSFLSEDLGTLFSNEETELLNRIKVIYEKRISAGIAREQARKDLPLSTYTEAYWKIDLHNLFHFLKLRMDSHAQLEIRSYAKIIGEEIVKKWCPIAWEAFVDYKLNAEHFSGIELKVLSFLQSNRSNTEIRQILLDQGFISKKGAPTRELIEFEAKLKKHGFIIQWEE